VVERDDAIDSAEQAADKGGQIHKVDARGVEGGGREGEVLALRFGVWESSMVLLLILALVSHIKRRCA
jgi:hypothetical protein